MANSLVERLVSTENGKRRFLQERAIRKATDLIEQLLEERGMGRADLASAMGRTRSWVTQLLDGDKNNTVRTIADVLAVLDLELDFGAKPFELGKPRDRIPTVSAQLSVTLEVNGDGLVNPTQATSTRSRTVALEAG